MSNSDIIAAAATFIALVSLAATLWQARIGRRHNILSVRPHLDWAATHSMNGEPLALEIVNFGLGPAIVESYEVEVVGRRHLVDRTELPQEMCTALLSQPFGVEWTTITPGTPIAAGATRTLFQCHFDEDDRVAHGKASAFIKRISFTVRYRSMYGEKFTLEKASDA